MPVSTELQPEGLPAEQIGWFRVLATVDSPAEDIRTVQVWHPFHHARCTLTLFPGIDALQHRALEADARRLRGIGHPALMPVLDVVDAGGRTGLLVQGVGGYSLRDCLNEVGALEVEEAVAIFRQVLSGVAALHQSGLTHGDLRPENIQLDVSEDRLIARLRGLGRATLERWDLHSPYLSPELASGGSADPRADVFSLGCIFYECLAGRAPFSEIDPWSRRQEIRDSPPEPLQNIVDRLPLEVAFAIGSALKFHAAERFANARAFARALPRDEGRLHTEEIRMPRETSEEVITGTHDAEITPDPSNIATDEPVTRERRASRSAVPEGRHEPTGGATSRAENQPSRPLPTEDSPFLGPEPGLGERMAAAPIDAVIMSSRLLRILAAPALATIFLMVLWNWKGAQDTMALRDDVEAARADLDPLFARSLKMADQVIAVGVEPNLVRPLVASFESANGFNDQLQAGHTLVTTMFRHVRSLKPSSDDALNRQRRTLEVQLNALDREYAEFREKNDSLNEATSGSLLGQLVELLR
jgi:serine/threonine protein kinase